LRLGVLDILVYEIGEVDLYSLFFLITERIFSSLLCYKIDLKRDLVFGDTSSGFEYDFY